VAEKPPFRTETLETAPEELVTGATFAGRYHIVEELGKGGMGKVYRAIDKKLNEEVALKLIRPEIAREERTLERFQNELKIARKISHRHVGRMYELMEAKGVHFITMEYVAGQNLRGLIRQTGQLTVRKAVSIATQVLEGLAEAHRLGVVHRDLKPSNIIIDREGSARIIDFGIARTAETKGKTGAGAVIGTPEYMAPEQVEGKPADQRADLYALGVILFEMVTGRPPFEGETPLAVAVKHKTDPPPDPRAADPGRARPRHPPVARKRPRQAIPDERGIPGRPRRDRGGLADNGTGRLDAQAGDLEKDHGRVHAEKARHPGGRNRGPPRRRRFLLASVDFAESRRGS